MNKKKITKHKLGQWGEDFAVNYLKENGINIIDRNIRTEYGEIDILGRKGESIIFFEVKTRRSREFGNPEDAVDNRKIEHVVNSALDYIQKHPEYEIFWRIDVIAINLKSNGDVAVEWFKNAISS